MRRRLRLEQGVIRKKKGRKRTRKAKKGDS